MMDFHRYQAAKMFGVDFDKVTPEQRIYAKKVAYLNSFGTANVKVNCQNCVCLVEKEGKPFCDQLNQPVEEIQICPET